MSSKRMILVLLLAPTLAVAQFGRLGDEAAHAAIKQDAASRSADGKPKEAKSGAKASTSGAKATTNGAKTKPDAAKGTKAAPEGAPKGALPQQQAR